MTPYRYESGRRILWVDDRPNDNRPIAAHLERRGFHISYALSTGLALVLLSKNKYFAVISDMGRPEGIREGFHLLDSMRGRDDQTPVIFYASLDAPALREEAALHDAQGCTNNSAELIQLIEKLGNCPR
ncbi:response regulator [Paucibacter sp. TC2R-5]|uniref:response regulator n=1 Tax=Paucibacter sp. TC2R-5 TaxID=2893555 RepID=UPI0021E3D5B6|nr:response regulator [Paucibacter sp. TC2R-5]MCV2360040.1 response regulator [Paucibacter sp. TC2R-5]